jgi:hypothetical protein
LFSKEEKDNIDSWEYEDFDYEFSTLGFRDKEIPKEIDLAAFGCSFTFGNGLPFYKLWFNQLNRDLVTYNFGQPGASIKAVSDIFHIVTNNVRIKKAVFLLPNYTRDLITHKSAHLPQWNNIRFVNLMPKLSQFQIELTPLHEGHYKYTPDEEFIRKMKDEIYLIDYMARLKNIEIFFSSWDEPTYQLLTCLNLKHAKIINQWVWPKNNLDRVKARDKMHPGMYNHKYWADQIRDIVCK